MILTNLLQLTLLVDLEISLNLIVSVMLASKNNTSVSEMNIAHWHKSCFRLSEADVYCMLQLHA